MLNDMKRNGSIWGLAVFLALVIAEAVVFSWGGWERGDVAFQSASSSCNGCITLGTKQFWADSGDALEMSYDVDLRRGCGICVHPAYDARAFRRHRRPDVDYAKRTGHLARTRSRVRGSTGWYSMGCRTVMGTDSNTA